MVSHCTAPGVGFLDSKAFEPCIIAQGDGANNINRLEVSGGKPALRKELRYKWKFPQKDDRKSTLGKSQSIRAITLTMPDIPLDASGANATLRQVLMNTDADAYPEQTDWVRANQAVLGIDLNGDGKLGAKELLTGDLAWLDANRDGKLDASDPAFAAIRVWNDSNGDGQSLKPRLDAQGRIVKDDQGNTVYESEAQSLGSAGIAGIDFAGDQITVRRSDGTRQHATNDSIWMLIAQSAH